MITSFILTDYRWYITNTSDPENANGLIRTGQSEPTINLELEWEYFLYEPKECVADR